MCLGSGFIYISPYVAINTFEYNCGEGPIVKIGKANCPINRMKDYKTNSHGMDFNKIYTLKLSCSCEKDCKRVGSLERYIHKNMKKPSYKPNSGTELFLVDKGVSLYDYSKQIYDLALKYDDKHFNIELMTLREYEDSEKYEDYDEYLEFKKNLSYEEYREYKEYKEYNDNDNDNDNDSNDNNDKNDDVDDKKKKKKKKKDKKKKNKNKNKKSVRQVDDLVRFIYQMKDIFIRENDGTGTVSVSEMKRYNKELIQFMEENNNPIGGRTPYNTISSLYTHQLKELYFAERIQEDKGDHVYYRFDWDEMEEYVNNLSE